MSWFSTPRPVPTRDERPPQPLPPPPPPAQPAPADLEPSELSHALEWVYDPTTGTPQPRRQRP